MKCSEHVYVLVCVSVCDDNRSVNMYIIQYVLMNVCAWTGLYSLEVFLSLCYCLHGQVSNNSILALSICTYRVCTNDLI